MSHKVWQRFSFPCAAVLLSAGLISCGDSSSGSDMPDLGGSRFGEVNPEQLRRMVEIDPADDGPFHMINLIKYREMADYPDGRETDLTGREADALYAPIEFLEAIGASVVFVAESETQLITYDGVVWDRVAIVNYPSRALFLQMSQDPAFQERAIHKDAGVEKTLVIVAIKQSGVEAPEPDDIPNPATPSDPPVAVTHLLAYNEIAQYEPGSNEPERSGKEAMDLYTEGAAPVALEQGVSSLDWFDIEGVLIGDGREWDEFRINIFPSSAAFAVVVADPGRQAGEVHRVAAIEDTYSMANVVSINALDGGAPTTLLEVTENGTGKICEDASDCQGQDANTCLSGDGPGFCTVEGCTAGTCQGDYLCCHDCADFAQVVLPFEGSACLPAIAAPMLMGTPMCTCD